MTETVRPAFRDRQLPRLSYGIPFHAAAARHVEEISQASRVYIICSRSLAQNTNALQQLKAALGARVIGQRIGMKSHTLWSEVVEIVTDARAVNADLLVTLGAGSLTDGAKIVALVCNDKYQYQYCANSLFYIYSFFYVFVFVKPIRYILNKYTIGTWASGMVLDKV